MPKPSRAELLQRIPPAIVPTKATVIAATDKSANKDPCKSSKSSAPCSGTGIEASSVAATASWATASAAQLDSYLTFLRSPSPCPSLSPSSPGEPRSRSSSDDEDSSDWSDFEFLDGSYRQMCNPRDAKALSAATGRFYAVTSPDLGGLVPGDEPDVDGMILHGYTDGKPIYYKYSGIHADLKAIETETVFGTRYVRQPVESCFDHLPVDLDGDSGYVSLQESESAESSSAGVPPNRIFSNEWFKVGKSTLGGYGVFALKNIEPCTSILLERPFMRLKNYNTLRQRYEKLSPEEKIVFDGLHAYAKDQPNELIQRANANSFMFGGGEGIFAIASNFNHACHMKRNTQYHWDPWRRVMVFTTDSHVAEGEELLISYGEGRICLQEKFGFLCTCGSCEGLTGWILEARAW